MLGNLLERVCKKTEFEVEGWRKIPPLMDKLEQNIPTHVQQSMKLEMITNKPVFEKDVFDEAFRMRDSTKLRLRESFGPGKTIRDSWIYEHFSNKDKKQSKIALYVNAVIPINQNFDASQLKCIGNHCVVVSGLAKWPNSNGIECLELENNGGCEETKYIPVDFPFFEEVQIEVTKLREKHPADEKYKNAMNKLGRKWAEQKWGKIEKNWYELKKETKEGQKIVDEAKKQGKYDMLFVRGIHPCFQLKFTS